MCGNLDILTEIKTIYAYTVSNLISRPAYSVYDTAEKPINLKLKNMIVLVQLYM